MTADEVVRSAESLLAAAAAFGADGATARRPPLERGLRCTGEVLAEDQVAMVHLALGVEAWLRAEVGTALASLQVARAIEPDLRLPVGVVGGRDALADLFEASRQPPVVQVEPLTPPLGSTTVVNGAIGNQRPTNLPGVLQYVDGTGLVYWSRLLPAGSPLPDDLPVQPDGPAWMGAVRWALQGLYLELEVGGGYRATDVDYILQQAWTPMALSDRGPACGLGCATYARAYPTMGLHELGRLGLGVHLHPMVEVRVSIGAARRHVAYAVEWEYLEDGDGDFVRIDHGDRSIARSPLLPELGATVQLSPWRGAVRPFFRTGVELVVGSKMCGDSIELDYRVPYEDGRRVDQYACGFGGFGPQIDLPLGAGIGWLRPRGAGVYVRADVLLQTIQNAGGRWGDPIDNWLDTFGPSYPRQGTTFTRYGPDEPSLPGVLLTAGLRWEPR